MSGSQTKQGGEQPGSAGADPSMEDILASIRRILSEEDVPASGPSSEAAEKSAEQEQDVLLLDSSMLVAEVSTTRPAIRARAVPPPPPPVLVVHEQEPAEPAPVAAKRDTKSAPEPAQPEAKQVEAEKPEAEPAESILAEIATEQFMADSGITAAVEQTVVAELPASAPEAEARSEAAGFAPVKTEAAMPAEAIPPATGSQASSVPRGGQAAEPPVSPTSSPSTEIQPTPPEPSTTPQSESSVMSASMSSTGLASAETANAAAGSVTNLVRALTSDRSSQVFGGGPTIADLVREELRPMLKAWLDSNLPPLVERLVRAEIERVISRATV